MAAPRLRIELFEVYHFRGTPPQFLQKIGELAQATRFDDDVRVADQERLANLAATTAGLYVQGDGQAIAGLAKAQMDAEAKRSGKISDYIAKFGALPSRKKKGKRPADDSTIEEKLKLAKKHRNPPVRGS